MTLATTYQETETEVAALGGIIHIFRPLELFLQDREVAKKNLEATYNRLSEAEKSQLAAFL